MCMCVAIAQEKSLGHVLYMHVCDLLSYIYVYMYIVHMHDCHTGTDRIVSTCCNSIII